jgi:peptidyl-prolyl cis-trans isomerase C
MYRNVVYLAVLVFSISLGVYGNALAQDDVLAKFGDREITISDLNKTIGFLDSQKQEMIEQNPQLKEQLLSQLVQSIVIADMARKAGYDKQADVIDRLKFFTDNYLATEYLKREVVNKITVSEDDIKSYYDTHMDEFKTPEMLRVRHILISVDTGASEEEKQKAKEKAEDILNKINSGEDFTKLASEFSDDTTTKLKGGDLGFISRGRLVKPFEDAMFALKPGEVSNVVETQFGYHIIKAEEKKDAGVESFDSVKDKIKQKMIQERMQSEVLRFIEKAMKEAGVEFHTELLTEGQKKE